MEMARAYAAFANGGRRVEPHLIRKVGGPPRPGPLGGQRRPGAGARPRGRLRAHQHPAGRGEPRHRQRRPQRWAYSGPAAGKTGTTNDATDVWFVGYTPELVGGVWMGIRRSADDRSRRLGRRPRRPRLGPHHGRVYAGPTRPRPGDRPPASPGRGRAGHGLGRERRMPRPGRHLHRVLHHGPPRAACRPRQLRHPAFRLPLGRRGVGRGHGRRLRSPGATPAGIDWPELEELRRRIRGGSDDPATPTRDPARRMPPRHPRPLARPAPAQHAAPRVGAPAPEPTSRSPPSRTGATGTRAAGRDGPGSSAAPSGATAIPRRLPRLPRLATPPALGEAVGAAGAGGGRGTFELRRSYCCRRRPGSRRGSRDPRRFPLTPHKDCNVVSPLQMRRTLLPALLLAVLPGALVAQEPCPSRRPSRDRRPPLRRSRAWLGAAADPRTARGDSAQALDDRSSAARRRRSAAAFARRCEQVDPALEAGMTAASRASRRRPPPRSRRATRPRLRRSAPRRSRSSALPHRAAAGPRSSRSSPPRSSRSRPAWRAKMKELDPEAEQLIARFQELEKMLSSAMQGMGG